MLVCVKIMETTHLPIVSVAVNFVPGSSFPYCFLNQTRKLFNNSVNAQRVGNR